MCIKRTWKSNAALVTIGAVGSVRLRMLFTQFAK